MSAYRKLSIGRLFCTLVGVLLLFGTSSADAAFRLLPLPAFGPVAEPSNVAVDQANSDIYVAAIGENAVDKFKPKAINEYELASKITGGETPQTSFAMFHNEPAAVAVDGSDGALYVADLGHHVVDKFNAEGKYICQLSGVGRGCHANPEIELGGAPTFGEPTGVLVDSHGNVYVSDYTHEVIDEFTALGADVTQITGCGITHPSGLAIDSSEVLYVQNYESKVVSCPSGSILDSQASYDVAVDPLTNDVYVDHGSSVAVYGPSPTNLPLDTVSVGPAESRGVAINGIARRVYVSDNAESKILVFEPVVVPDVKLSGEATEVGPTTATLHGEINPDGTSEASYHFEYGPTNAFGSSTVATAVGEVNEFVPATAELTGLQPNTTYHYRLSATNSSGIANTSEEGTFTTAIAPPIVSEVEASEVTTSSVIFRGLVNPQGAPTHYRFEYGETASYGQHLPDIAIGSSPTPIPVEQASPSDLKPSTIYHYRLVAVDSAGEVPSPDQTFTTASNGTSPETPPVVSTGPAEAIAQNSATLTGTVYAENTPTTYRFELGTSTAYGSIIFGGEAGREGGAVAVAQPVGNLQPGVTYHFRLVAVNAAGTTIGADLAFTTTTFPQEIVQPLTPGLVPIPVFPPVKNPVLKHRGKKVKKHAKKKPKRRRRAHGGRARAY